MAVAGGCHRQVISPFSLSGPSFLMSTPSSGPRMSTPLTREIQEGLWRWSAANALYALTPRFAGLALILIEEEQESMGGNIRRERFWNIAPFVLPSACPQRPLAQGLCLFAPDAQALRGCAASSRSIRLGLRPSALASATCSCRRGIESSAPSGRSQFNAR